MEVQLVALGGALTAPAAPQQDGFEFIGWSISTDGADVFDYTSRVMEEMTLYATWRDASASCPGVKDNRSPGGPVPWEKPAEKSTVCSAPRASAHRRGWRLPGVQVDSSENGTQCVTLAPATHPGSRSLAASPSGAK
ncbi:InlB B-repeat-containing protein [Leucobacter chromiireducens]|uniref:Bacterial repeat domain-containing protein n=1 Tax=Leucobacter chromiireducens subsp. chromiireducens TaxID=660067 RepID=A0ABS1SLB4_9MICO|nr:hypothetical protein [Leucobacter chromiireducens subsp. chromiireducens]